MSRIGKTPITLPQKVTTSVVSGIITVEGPRGKLSWELPKAITTRLEGTTLLIERANEERATRALHGLARALINNMVLGVHEGFRRDLEIQGVGFRSAVKGEHLDLSIGYSHPVLFKIPQNIKITVTDNTKISIEGIDKHLVGQVAADIRAYYPPEPYKGKGIRYAGEQVRRKEGKTVQ
ncbi:MAG: 50S ribosomal protein L6 [Verrucomicrobia bacterium RIFCSPHIGHO2_12_FULL_41_10]|nr:MAG: 50S ribosomal protein L6 [Verrucomicrobia bacterium RIFCSPHIGHO2_12_FULL_41_10]HLB32830.1 50S ribosomal protein L6 [Chthoniobacterales bacterium]